tara:strand:- start:505 stop:885 length:381 start_codon:yes stop_codon:yes gene_type:complete
MIAQVPLITLSSHDPDELGLIYAQLLSPFATAWYLSRYGHLDQTGAGVDLRVPALAEMPMRPWPAVANSERNELHRRLEALAAHPGSTELKAVQCFALDLMGQPREQLMTWWWERLPKKLIAGYNR